MIQVGDNGPIKIGVAKNPAARLKELQTGNSNELKLLVAIDVPNDWEPSIHRCMARYRIRGEWFQPGEGPLDLLRDFSIRVRIGGDHANPDPAAFERESWRYYLPSPERLQA